MNLIIGATGLLGMEICRQLLSDGRPTRALVRQTADAGKRAELDSLGVELVAGDLKDRRSLDRACAGVRAVISTASSTFSRQEGDSIRTVDELGQIALVDAARAAGVERFIFISFRHGLPVPYPLATAKHAVEQHLAVSGMGYTILQASFFMEIWLTPMLGFDPVNGKVRICGDGTKKISWVAYRDVARVAVAALETPAARNLTIEVGGPEALSPREVVRMFEAAGMAEIAAEYVPTAILESQFAAADEPLQKSFAGLMLQYAAGDGINPMRMKELFALRLTSVRDYVSTQLAHR